MLVKTIIFTNKKDEVVNTLNNLIEDLLRKNNGLLKASDARLMGIDNKILQRLTKVGELERVAHGLYLGANYIEDEYLIAQYRCTRGIFSHETALFFHNLSDRTPFRLTMTVPSGYYSRIITDKDSYQFFYCKPELHELGITTVQSPFGNSVRVYNKERTICDCIKKKDKLDADLVLSAVKQYMGELGNDYALLLKYADMFKIRESVKQYLEVLS